MGKKKRLKREKEKRSDSDKMVSETVVHGISSGWYYIIRYIAMIAMLLDHVGRVLYDLEFLDEETLISFVMVGRIAFPLFCFLLVESFYFTKNRKKHLFQIGFLFLLSEIFFDMALILKSPLKFNSGVLKVQNTCLTLFLGFLMLSVKYIDFHAFFSKYYNSRFVRKICAECSKIVTVGLFSFLAVLLKSDYVWRGIVLIALLDYARGRTHKTIWQTIAFMFFVVSTGSAAVIYLPVFFVLIPISIAQKEKNINSLKEKIYKIITGKVSARICRFFYPVHLIILAVIKIIVL